MKSKKSKQKEVKNKKIQKEKGINEIENDILSSPKNINLFNKLIEIFINNIENKDEEKIREIMNSLKNILTYFLKNENVKSSNELITFLNDKIQLIYKIILDSIFSSDIDEDESFLPIIFHILYELINFIPEDKVNSLFNDFISKLISIEKEISPSIINSFYEQFNTISYYNYIFNSFLDILTSKKIKNQNEFNNFYFFVTNINDLDSLLEINDNNLNNEDDERKLNELKEKYQNIIINFVNEKLLPLSLIKEFMKILNKKIVQNVVNPIIFSDYLLNKTNEIKIKSINDFDIQIFGLSSLFVLLTKYNLDYDKYYELLYKLISQKFNGITIFDSLLRISLFSKVEIIYSLLSLVMKIIQLHPRTLNLIMDNKSKKILKKNIESNSTFLNGSNANENNLDEIKNCISLEEEDEEKSNNIINYDNFDESSTDPFKTNAEQCCLWELYSFTRHYNMGIRKLVNKFSRNFLAKEIEMELKSQKDVYFDIKNLNSHFYINN